MVDTLYINFVTQKIIDDNFSSKNKRRVVQHPDRLNFCCPYCGDGMSEHKKRGNIYYNKLVYVCFNCDKKTNFTRFCKDFNQNIDPDKKLEILNYLDSIISVEDYNQGDLSSYRLENLISLEKLQDDLQKRRGPIFDLKPASKNPSVYNYLLKRNIPESLQSNIWSANYRIGENYWEPVICFLNRKSDSLISIQIRNLKEGRKRMFKVYNYEFLWSFVNPGSSIETIDLSDLTLYNKLGNFLNIMSVDFEKKITIFEGYIDSLFYPNSIGVIGVNTDFSFLENNNLELQYFFDNDKTGQTKAGDKIHQGFSVFLWYKFFESLIDKKKPQDPYKYLDRIKKIKDLNGLSLLVDNPYQKLNLSEFFSRDILDIGWIPKYKRDRKNYIYRK